MWPWVQLCGAGLRWYSVASVADVEALGEAILSVAEVVVVALDMTVDALGAAVLPSARVTNRFNEGLATLRRCGISATNIPVLTHYIFIQCMSNGFLRQHQQPCHLGVYWRALRK